MMDAASSDFVGGIITYSKTRLNWPLKRGQKMLFKTDYRLMHIKNIAECSKALCRSKVLQNAPLRAFCNAFDLHLAIIDL